MTLQEFLTRSGFRRLLYIPGVALAGHLVLLSPGAHRSLSGRLPGDTVPLATITTDTGALAPGNTEFSRFSTPGMCIAAVGIAQDVGLRSMAAQMASVFKRDTITGDALPANAVHVAQSCASRFTVAGTPANTLPDLLTLELMADNDTLAQAVIDRQLAAATTARARATVLQNAVDHYLHAEPHRVAAAQATTAQIDRLGLSVQDVRIQAHALLLASAVVVYTPSVMRREAEQIIALARAIPTDSLQLEKGDVFAAYAALSAIAYIEHPDSVMAVAQRAKDDLARFGRLPNGISVSNPILMADFGKISVTRVRDALLPYNPDQYAGQTLPPITAAYWFPHAPGAWPPSGGRASLVIYGGWLANDCARSGSFLLSSLGGMRRSECGALYTYLPRWKRDYGDRLAITLVSQTMGFAARSLALAPAAEADTLNWFFREHLRLPVTLGVTLDTVWRLPPSDGRQFWRDTTFYGHISGAAVEHGESNLIVLLYNAQGKVEYLGEFNVPILKALIARELNAASSTPVRPS